MTGEEISQGTFVAWGREDLFSGGTFITIQTFPRGRSVPEGDLPQRKVYRVTPASVSYDWYRRYFSLVIVLPAAFISWECTRVSCNCSAHNAFTHSVLAPHRTPVLRGQKYMLKTIIDFCTMKIALLPVCHINTYYVVLITTLIWCRSFMIVSSNLILIIKYLSLIKLVNIKIVL